MGDVKVNRLDLLEKVRANRDKHRAVFLEAMEGYREDAIAELDRAIQDAKAGKKIKRSIELVEPMDMTAEYDRVVAMLEMCVEDVVTIDENNFSCYVLDRWRWREQFVTSTANYMKGNRK